MSKLDKLLRRLGTLPQDMRFEELDTILRRFGYVPTETRGGSRHITYRKNGQSITIPRHTPIKRCYIRLVRDAIKDEKEQDQ